MKRSKAPSSPASLRTPAQLGQAIRRRRRELGISQAELATKANVRQSTISSLEGGKGGRLDIVFRILGALGLDMAVSERATSADDIGSIF